MNTLYHVLSAITEYDDRGTVQYSTVKRGVDAMQCFFHLCIYFIYATTQYKHPLSRHRVTGFYQRISHDISPSRFIIYHFTEDVDQYLYQWRCQFSSAATAKGYVFLPLDHFNRAIEILDLKN